MNPLDPISIPGAERRETFERIWAAAHGALGAPVPGLPDDVGAPIPHHSEGWYCCAEPTARQLAPASEAGL